MFPEDREKIRKRFRCYLDAEKYMEQLKSMAVMWHKYGWRDTNMALIYFQKGDVTYENKR